MIVNRSCLKEFAEKLHSLPSSLTKSDLLISPFHLHQENELDIYYSLIMNISIGMPCL